MLVGGNCLLPQQQERKQLKVDVMLEPHRGDTQKPGTCRLYGLLCFCFFIQCSAAYNEACILSLLNFPCISRFPLWAYSKGNFKTRVVMKISHQDSGIGIGHCGVLNSTSCLVWFYSSCHSLLPSTYIWFLTEANSILRGSLFVLGAFWVT